MDIVVTLLEENVYFMRIYAVIMLKAFKLILHIDQFTLNTELKADCTFLLIFEM